MRPLLLLKCIARAALHCAGNLVGIESGDAAFQIAEEAWRQWSREQDDAQRRAEMQALVQLAGGEFRQQVEAVVREVAAGQPPEVCREMSVLLERVTERIRGRRLPEKPPEQARDLLPFLSDGPGPPPATEPPGLSRVQVALQFTQGYRSGEETVYTEPTVLLFGRAADCHPQLPQKGHESVSRHHCLVEINPPDICIRDLGSLHGTFVDGTLIGKRPPGTDPAPGQESPEHDLANGTEVRLTEEGRLAFRVRIHIPARCGACGALIAEDQKGDCALPSGGYLCRRCRQSNVPATAGKKQCAWCRKDVADERGANRPGLFVCAACRANTEGKVRSLAAQAQAGNPELQVIQDYTLGPELGQGGMGAVYLAQHDRTGQQVALKVMLPKIAADADAVTMFQREVRNTMALQHRHVVRLLDHGYSGGAFFLVLEYCDGGSVDQLLVQRGGPLPVDEAGEIILQALEGLEYAHQAEIPFVRQKGGGFAPGKGLVHRDLKPANLFLTGGGSGRLVKIGDYGLAKAFDEIGLSGGTRTGEIAGTWEYMCRQQVIDYRSPRPKVDVWALAASLYYLLTGCLPRTFPSDKDPWLTVLETNPVPILQRNPSLPRRLAQLIDHALTEEPDIPFQTATQLKAELETVL